MIKKQIENFLASLQQGNIVLSSLSDSAIPLTLAEIFNVLQKLQQSQEIIFLVNDSARVSEIESAFAFFAPEIEIVHLAAWDCLPYDRVSPSQAALANRLYALTVLAKQTKENVWAKSRLILATPAALLQKVPPRQHLLSLTRHFATEKTIGKTTDIDSLPAWLSAQGFVRVSTVRVAGEYAVRGSIIDIFAPGAKDPIRLDYFGDELTSIRTFDADSQRTKTQIKEITLSPMNEITLDKKSISLFRNNYLELFGVAKESENENNLYYAISEGRQFIGMEHYLPLFFEKLETLFDYFANRLIIIDSLVKPAVQSGHEQICEHHQVRLQEDENYKTIDWQKLYLSPEQIEKALSKRNILHLSSFDFLQTPLEKNIKLDIKQGYNYLRLCKDKSNLFSMLNQDINDFHKRNIGTLIACCSEGSRQRLMQILREHYSGNMTEVENWHEFIVLPKNQLCFAVLELQAGFRTNEFVIIAEQDILGTQLQARKPKNKARSMLVELSNLEQGDYVVHVEHGVARFAGLASLQFGDSVHDCLDLRYYGDDKLFLPVENIELLSRFGSAQAPAVLDKLGLGNWQARKARAKKNILAIAGELIAIAAARQTQKVAPIAIPTVAYAEFCAGFAYEETQDQRQAIEDVLDDLSNTIAMDRLICGDVGFGKTEVALRAAFLVASAGKQVAIIVPTTLLARQHYATFLQRFQNFPIRVAQASRLVKAKTLSQVKENIKEGEIDIVIGTHALLGKAIEFKNLGLLIIDEEQHFGVKHKERLKKLKKDVHVLTLTATPIPRTLQLSLSGVRELSIITTPPIDRMAVRTFISPFDKVSLRQALLRERYRGGRSFYVCPRISDLPSQAKFLAKEVPELKIAVAHAKLPPSELENIMIDFYEGEYDVLLSTTIIESGLDIPSANTLIVYRADMFGLSQLYQLRGRVGRAKVRAYAFMTLSQDKMPTKNAQKRLELLSSLDTLGAGFQLASHDLDIRGAGNILGEEQSGHVREVGYELYQKMLQEAVQALQFEGKGGDKTASENQWSPRLGLGLNVMIPQNYVADLNLRLALYRRLGNLQTKTETDNFASELIDRFGAPMPQEIENLLRIVLIKAQCRKANIERIDVGKKGISLHFKGARFDNVDGLMAWIASYGDKAQIRQDQSIVLQHQTTTADKKLSVVENIVNQLAAIAKGAN